jgi:hypothetical protein
MAKLWWQTAEPEEQGSFCNTRSEATYENKEWKDTANEAAQYEESFYDDRSELGGGARRANSVLLEEDDQGLLTPARHRVGGT